MPQLTVNDEYILDYLLEHARQTQTELQERIGAGISPSSVGRSLNRLEDYGYVEQCHTFDRETLKPKTVYRVTADGKAKRMDSDGENRALV